MVIGNYSKQDNPAKLLLAIFRKKGDLLTFLRVFLNREEGKFSAFFDNSP